MQHAIDLTGEYFVRVDFSEAEFIDLPVPCRLPETLEIPVWGGTLLLGSMWQHSKAFMPEQFRGADRYVAGQGTLRITGLIGGSIQVSPYETAGGRQMCVKKQDGSPLVCQRTWKPPRRGREYQWNCITRWPYGLCSLTLIAGGEVTYTFDDGDLVLTQEYSRTPWRYQFRG